MRPALDRVRDAISHLQIREPGMPVVSNVSGRPTREPSALRDLLSRHLVSPVRWERSMRAMADSGVDAFVEAGPGDVLTKLLRRNVPGRLSCDAFPEGIPERVYFNLDVHTRPIEGDHGIQFAPQQGLDEKSQRVLNRLLQTLAPDETATVD